MRLIDADKLMLHLNDYALQESIVDEVVGWHYEVIPTDAISRCEPFCYSMPLTKDYIDRCEMEVVGSIFDN